MPENAKVTRAVRAARPTTTAATPPRTATPTGATGAARPGGRSARVVTAVLEATRGELARVGFAALSVERVAELAGVAKTTVYRRWPQKTELVRDALLQRIQAFSELPEDRGTLLDQLTEYGFARAEGMQRPEGQATVRMLYGEGLNPEVRELVRTLRKAKLVDPLELFQRAVRRAEIHASVDAEMAWQLVMSSLHHRVFLLGEHPTRADVRELVRIVLYGILGAEAQEALSRRQDRR